MTNVLTNIQINQILKNNRDFRGCFCLNEIDMNCRNGYYIINLDHSKNGGTHWVAFYKGPKIFLYFDSMGVTIPKEIGRCANTLSEIYYNDKQIQNYRASSCGYYCICFIKYVNSKATFINFLNHFSYFTEINDTKLFELLNK